MLRGSSRSRNFFKKLVVNGVNNSKAAIQNDCLMRLYDADAELKAISSELDSFDGKKDPIRCNLLVNQLRTAQDKVISLLFQLMDDCNCERASRDYRMKFPDEILLSEGSESLNGQIWFGAECLSAGSNILNHTKESTMLRPMAKTLTQHLDSLRNDLRDLVIDGGGASRINQSLIKKMVAFDHIFAQFEYEYVRTMLPIRTVVEIEKLQEVAVLFSETLIDCVKRGLIKQDDIDEFQPIVMIAIPRLAIVRGLLYKNENPIYTRHKSQMCSLFQPFHGPLHSIRKLLRGLSPQSLFTLERMLANDQSIGNEPTNEDPKPSEPTEQATNTNGPSSTNDNHCDQQAASSSQGHYSMVLMDGLQYPVGHKRNSVEADCSGECHRTNSSRNSDQEQQDYNCYLEVRASSSKAISSSQEQGSPVNSTPSPSSSLSSGTVEKCRKGSTSRSNNDCNSDSICNVQKNVCEDNSNCCVSPPESDAQLEKLIANFSQSMTNDQSDLEPTSSTALPIVCGTGTTVSVNDDHPTIDTTCTTINNDTTVSQDITTTTASDNSDFDSELARAKAEEELALEELFQKQAQQLLHRLFVAISGVADQLQSNFASDLRFILRHIFSSEIAGDDDEDDEVDEETHSDDIHGNTCNELDGDGEYSNQSDSSLPIEQGIEAQEIVANLIDLDSGYPINETYATDYSFPVGMSSHRTGMGALLHHQTSTSEFPYLHHTSAHTPVVTDLNRYSSPATSSIYMPSSQHQSSNNHIRQQQQQLQQQYQVMNSNSLESNANARALQDSLNEELNNEILADLMRASDQNDLIYEPRASPNEASLLEEVQHRQQVLLQQHLQSQSSRSSATGSSRAHRSSLANGGQQIMQTVDGSGGQPPVVHEHHRRSRHHHHSRSRRSRGPPVWVPDQLVVQCNRCNVPFTLFRRRHHCRACGQIFCADCSRYTKNLNCWGYNGPVRVCESCYNQP